MKKTGFSSPLSCLWSDCTYRMLDRAKCCMFPDPQLETFKPRVSKREQQEREREQQVQEREPERTACTYRSVTGRTAHTAVSQAELHIPQCHRPNCTYRMLDRANCTYRSVTGRTAHTAVSQAAGWARIDWRQRTRLGLEVHIKPWNRLCETDL